MLVDGEIHFGTLRFIADDSVWFREAPLDVEVLPVCVGAHFRIFVWCPSPAALSSVPILFMVLYEKYILHLHRDPSHSSLPNQQ